MEFLPDVQLFTFCIMQEERQQRSRQLSTDERQCRSYLTLTNETLEMFIFLTELTKAPFLRPVSSLSGVILSVHCIVLFMPLLLYINGGDEKRSINPPLERVLQEKEEGRG